MQVEQTKTKRSTRSLRNQVLLSSEEAGILCGCTDRTIQTLVARGVLPVVRIPGSRALRFRPEALTEVAKRFEVPAADLILDGGAE